MSLLAGTRGHDLSVANSVENDAPDFKYAKNRRVGQLFRLVSDALWHVGSYALGLRIVGAGLYFIWLNPVWWELEALCLLRDTLSANVRCTSCATIVSPRVAHSHTYSTGDGLVYVHISWFTTSIPWFITCVFKKICTVLIVSVIVNIFQCFLTNQQMSWIRRIDLCTSIGQRLFNESLNINFPLLPWLPFNKWQTQFSSAFRPLHSPHLSLIHHSLITSFIPSLLTRVPKLTFGIATMWLAVPR